jgi:putative AlgH/UPF0301 family transcriptional regulator
VSIAQYIIRIDNLRRTCLEGYEIWKRNQKDAEAARDFAFAKHCRNEAAIDWERFRNFDKILARIGVYTGTQEQEDWK